MTVGSIETRRRIVERLGLDAAVSFAAAGRVWAAASSLVSLWFVVRSLSPTEQGYYYTFNSLLAVQVFAELGVNFVIMQFVSHEMAQLQVNRQGALDGDATALGRVVSLTHFALRWFLILGTLFVVVITPLGLRFLARHQTGAAESVRWRGPWVASVALTAVALLLGPMLSILEGCGLVASAARARLYQAIASNAALWIALLLGARLAAVPISLVANAVALLVWFLLAKRPFFGPLLRGRPTERPMRILFEIAPMQWRIALSWLAGYFVAQLFTPVLFAARGAVEAGRMGMSVTITSGISTVALVWITTKSPLFGRLVALRRFEELDTTFRRALLHALQATGLACLGLAALFLIVYSRYPTLENRIVSAGALGALALGAVGSVILTAEAVYLRAFKREPFLPISIAVGVATAAATLTLARSLGSDGVAAGYCVVTWTVGVAAGTILFRRTRRSLKAEALSESINRSRESTDR